MTFSWIANILGDVDNSQENNWKYRLFKHEILRLYAQNFKILNTTI